MLLFKIIFAFLVIASCLQAGSFSFSINDGSINISNSSKLYIYFFDKMQDRYATVSVLKPLISLQKRHLEGTTEQFTSVAFTLFLKDNNNTVEIEPTGLLDRTSEFILTLDGTRIVDIFGTAYTKEFVSFVSDTYATLVFGEEENTTIFRGNAGSISLRLDSYAKDTIFKVSTNNELLRTFPSIVPFFSLNWDRPQEVTLYVSDDDVYKTGTADINFTEEGTGYFTTKTITYDDKISMSIDQNNIFTKELNASLNINLSKQPPEAIDISLTSTNANISLTPSIFSFDPDNWREGREIIIAKTQGEEESGSISITANNQFLIGDKNLTVKFVDPVIANLPFQTIKVVEITSVGVSLIWAIPELKAFDIEYRVYIGENEVSYTEAYLKEKLTKNKGAYFLRSGRKHKVGVVATYKVIDDLTELSADEVAIFTELDIETSASSLADENNNRLYDDFERTYGFVKKQGLNVQDSTSDGIPDVLQQYAADTYGEGKISEYDNYTDKDKDKMPDLMEISLGRLPTQDDYNGDSRPTIRLENKEVNLFITKKNTSSLLQLVNVSASSGQADLTSKLRPYTKEPCFKTDQVPYTIVLIDCGELKIEDMKAEVFTPAYWVVFDENNNLDFQSQSIRVFVGEESISYKTGAHRSSIFSPKDKVLFALGDYAKQAPSNNISLSLVQMPNIDEEQRFYTYSNNILDVRVLNTSPDVYTEVIIPQVVALQKDDKMRLYRDKNWTDFNASVDKIFSSKGVEKNCDISDNQYLEGIIEGAYCLKLQIKDASANDRDKKVNKVFSFTGGVATKIPLVVFENNASAGCSSLHAKDLSGNEAKIDILLVLAWLFSALWSIKILFKRKKITF